MTMYANSTGPVVEYEAFDVSCRQQSVTHNTFLLLASLSFVAVWQVVTALMPGPPFVFGALLVMLAIMVAAFIPDTNSPIFATEREEERSSSSKRRIREEGSKVW